MAYALNQAGVLLGNDYMILASLLRLIIVV